MKQVDALNVLADYARMHGTIEGFSRIGDKIKVKPNTIYGWWRRSSIPNWRLNAFKVFAKQSSRKSPCP